MKDLQNKQRGRKHDTTQAVNGFTESIENNY